MAKHKSFKTPAERPADGGKFVDRDLMKVNPLTEQFEPKDPDPVRQHAKMAGQP